MEIKQKGGKRENSGRKPSVDPKMPITVYLPKSKIEVYGVEIVKEKICSYVMADFCLNPVGERHDINIEKKDVKVIKPAISQKSIFNIQEKLQQAKDNPYPGRLEGESLIDYKIRTSS